MATKNRGVHVVYKTSGMIYHRMIDKDASEVTFVRKRKRVDFCEEEFEYNFEIKWKTKFRP